MDRRSTGALVAISVAALFSAGSAFATSHDGGGEKKDAKVKCMGVNECAGKNKCKGQGVVMMSTEDCTKKGGKIAN